MNRGRQTKIWEDNIKEWIARDFNIRERLRKAVPDVNSGPYDPGGSGSPGHRQTERNYHGWMVGVTYFMFMPLLDGRSEARCFTTLIGFGPLAICFLYECQCLRNICEQRKCNKTYSNKPQCCVHQPLHTYLVIHSACVLYF